MTFGTLPVDPTSRTLRNVNNRLRIVALAGATTAAATLPLILAAPASAAPAACESAARVICVDKSNQKLTLFENGSAVLSMKVRFGSDETPTRNGSFKIYNKESKHVSRIAGVPMPYAMFFSGGQAIHYSADFAKNGYNGSSLGCVNTRNLNETKQLFDDVAIGDTVYVYGSIPDYSAYDPRAYD
jgi:lipoprotein-anchoring transpeptidase ErfK/SrfK